MEETSLLCDPGPELRLGRGERKGEQYQLNRTRYDLLLVCGVPKILWREERGIFGFQIRGNEMR